MAFARRPTIEQLRHSGVEIVPANFVISRRPLPYAFITHPAGAPAPLEMPRHRLVQYYRMKRLDAAGDKLAMAVRPARYPTVRTEEKVTVAVVPQVAVEVKVDRTFDHFDSSPNADLVFLPDVDTPVEEAIDPPTRPKFRKR